MLEEDAHADYAARPAAVRSNFQPIPLVQISHAAPDPQTEFQQLLDWVGQGLQAMDEIPDEAVREQVFALLEGMDVVHRQGIGRLLELIRVAGGQAALDGIAADPVVHTLLDLYDLPEETEYEAAQRALAPAYSYIESHGGALELLDVRSGRVRVRLSGSCGSCPGSAGTLERVVEESLRDGFSRFVALVAEAPEPPKRTMIQLGPTVLRRPRWVDVGSLKDFPSGEMRALWPEGQGVLVVHLDGEVYAHQNACPPGSALALHLGTLEGSTLVCPWHGCEYDIRTGKRLDAEGRLGVLPVAVTNGAVRLAMGTEEITTP